MNKEEKDLLLKDLCARLPYGVKYTTNIIGRENDIETIVAISDRKSKERGYEGIFVNADTGGWDPIDNVKPYLRPLANMTETEKEELHQEHLKDEKMFIDCIKRAKNGDSSMRGKVCPHFSSDWCDRNGFDHRGLIEKELALEAPEGMYSN